MPSSGVLQEPFGRLPPSYMSWLPALRSPSQRFLNYLARRPAHSRVPNLLTSDQTTVDRLRKRLADNVPLDRVSFDQIKNCPQRASELEADRKSTRLNSSH